MHDLFPGFDINYNTAIITAIIVILVYLIALIIPGVGSVVKHITHTITKYIIHPFSKYVIEAIALLILKMIWWLFKYVIDAFRIYLYNLTRTHEKIYPKLEQKKIGIIDEN